MLSELSITLKNGMWIWKKGYGYHADVCTEWLVQNKCKADKWQAKIHSTEGQKGGIYFTTISLLNKQNLEKILFATENI